MKLFEAICIFTFVFYLSANQAQGQLTCYDGILQYVNQEKNIDTIKSTTCSSGFECGRIDVSVDVETAGTPGTIQQSQGSCLPIGTNSIIDICDTITYTIENANLGATVSVTGCCMASCSTDHCNDAPATSTTGYECKGSPTTGTGVFSGSAGLVGQQPLKLSLMSLLVFFVVMIVCK